MERDEAARRTGAVASLFVEIRLAVPVDHQARVDVIAGDGPQLPGEFVAVGFWLGGFA